MKHLARRILAVVLVMATIGALMTTGFAANTDTMKLTATPEEGNVTISRSKDTLFTVEAKITDAKGKDVTNEYAITYMWLLDGATVSEKSYYNMSKNIPLLESSFLLCTVTAEHITDHTRKTGILTWYPTDDLIKDINLTISDKVDTFYFGSSDTQTGVSVLSEICDALEISKTSEQAKYQVSFLSDISPVGYFEGTPVCQLNELSKLCFIVTSTGQWVAEYFVKLGDTIVLSGTLTISVEQRVGADAFYEARPGESVVVSADDFLNFWNDNADKNTTLESIYVTSCSGVSGVLCYDHRASEKQHTVANGLFMSVGAGSYSRTPLSDLTFIPHKFGTNYPEGTVTLNFIATGKDWNKESVVLSGSFVIFYSSTGAENITYDCNGTYVMLNTSDFTDVYRDMTNSTVKDPVYSVRFLDLPKFGTLYRGCEETSYGITGGTAVDYNNMDILVFSSVVTAENSLNKLAYIPRSGSSVGDTVRYLVYSGNKVLYVGTLTFNSKEVIVTYTTTVNTPVKLSSADFFTAGSPLLKAQFLVFGNPPSGTLYRDYANGVRVQTHEYYSYNANYGVYLLDDITYVPKEGYSGVVDIMFCGTSLTGGAVNGKVRVYVVRNDIFKDVAADHWAAAYINRLYSTGIISGTSATTFSPDNNMTYGQALKMILLAAGCPKQSETSGTHWASKYLEYAYINGYVSTSKIDLDAPIDRDAVAELAARVLGLEKAGSVNLGITGPVDSTNGYVYALYNAGILNGSYDKDGNNRYYGSDMITRAQVAKIICKINDYVQ